MIRFTNDYSEGCHPSILEAMAATNTEGNPGYSTDPHSARARRLIQAAIGRPTPTSTSWWAAPRPTPPPSPPSCGPTKR